MNKPLILEADRLLAYARIAELEQKIIDLGPEIDDAVNQSSETWHDNAPFEVLRDLRSSYTSDIRELRAMLFNSTKQIPRKHAGTISAGTCIELQDAATRQRHRYYMVGDWTLRAGELHEGALVISRLSPLGALLHAKKVGDQITFNNRIFVITAVQ